MAAITTEEAARRLARVILSDVELYNRERPKEGEDLEQQYAEGRRLFATRVSPEMVNVFDAVLEDRKNGKAQTNGLTNGHTASNSHMAAQMAAATPMIELTATPVIELAAAIPLFETTAVEAPVVTAPPVAALPVVAAPPAAAVEAANEFGNDEVTATGTANVAEDIHEQPTNPTLLSTQSDETTAEREPIPDLVAASVPAPAPKPVAPPAVEIAPAARRPTETARPKTPPPLAASRPLTPKPQPRLATPPPVPLSKAPTPPPLLKVATPAPPTLLATPPAPMAVASSPETDRAPTPPRPIQIAAMPLAEPPVVAVAATAPASGSVPTLKVGISIPKILLIVVIAAGLIAVIAHFARLSP